MERESVQEIIRRAETNYKLGYTILNDYVRWSLRDTVWKIYAYLNSRHTTGETDSLGREKPFFNIVTAAVNIWWKATNLDRKDIQVTPDSSKNVTEAFLANVLLQDWMKRARFGVFLKDWGRTLAQYGSAVVKFVVKDGELVGQVVSWLNLIVDPISFDAIPVIEMFYVTAAELRQNPAYDQEVVENLISATSATRRTLWGTKKDNQAGFIQLYEVHGMMPEALLSDDYQAAPDSEWKSYRQQMHVVSYIQGARGKIQDFTLYKGKEAKHPYMITHLMKEPGRTMCIGAVEYLFDAQWMANHTIKNWKDQLDLASKLVFQTADANFANRNVLTAIESGDILIHADNKPITQVPNTGHDITNLEGYLGQWNQLAQQVTNTPDALRGVTLPSATAYRQAALLSQSANSYFTIMTENKGLALEDILRTFVLPHLKTKLNNKDEVSAVLEDHNISKLDVMYLPKEAVRQYNQRAAKQVFDNTDALLKGGGQLSPIQPFNLQQEQQNVKGSMAQLGNQRFFAPGDVAWKDVFKDFEWDLDIQVTNEQHDKQMIFQTLSSVLQTIAGNPTILTDPNARMVFSKILDFTGIVSPIELQAPMAQTPTQQPTDQQAAPMSPAMAPNVRPVRQQGANLIS